MPKTNIYTLSLSTSFAYAAISYECYLLFKIHLSIVIVCVFLQYVYNFSSLYFSSPAYDCKIQ